MTKCQKFLHYLVEEKHQKQRGKDDKADDYLTLVCWQRARIVVVDPLQNARTDRKSNDGNNDSDDTDSKKKAFSLYSFLDSFEI